MLFVDFLDRAVKTYPDRAFIKDADGSLTYKDLGSITRKIAGKLSIEGVNIGTKIGIYSQNHRYCLPVQYGIFSYGAVWVPINYRASVTEAASVMQDMDVECLFFHSSLADAVKTIMRESEIRLCVCLDRPLDFAPSLEAWIADGEEMDGPVQKSSDVIAMGITGGTTGRPKGVELSHRAYSTMIASFELAMTQGAEPVHLLVAPVSHAAGYYATSMLPDGATHVILSATTPQAILEAIQTHRATTVFLPPTLIYMLLAHPTIKDFDLSSLRLLVYGAAPMSVEKLRQAIALFGPVFHQIYGQTEAIMLISHMSISDHLEALSHPEHEHRLLSAGRAGPLSRVEIMDDAGLLLPDGQRGEIVVRSDIVMNGYYKNPQATAAAGAHGWHHTGDIGYRDEYGFIYVVDRKNDMIISGGFNIYPAEVEQAVLAHPDVKDCAVIGVPDEKWGEAVIAAIEIKSGTSFDEAGMIQFCKDRLGSVKSPKKIVLVEALPRSPVGKVLRREVRAQYRVGQHQGFRPMEILP